MRSRGTKKRDAHFSEKANEELVNFCKACGFRRNTLERLKGGDLYDRERAEDALADAKNAGDTALAKAFSDGLRTFPEQTYFILHRNDKGGKTRLSPIVGPHKNQVVQRMKATPKDEKVWQYVNTNCDVHGYRADYATFLYKQCARPIETLDFHNKIRCADGKYRSEIYICRGSERRKRLDRRAVGIIRIVLENHRLRLRVPVRRVFPEFEQLTSIGHLFPFWLHRERRAQQKHGRRKAQQLVYISRP